MKLYALGSNGSGQLGLGHTDDANEPRLCRFAGEESSELVRLAASGNTTFLLFRSGNIYFAGADLGYNSQENSAAAARTLIFNKTVLKEGSNIKICAATWQASLLVAQSDHIYVCGRGEKGELGLGPDTRSTDSYTRLSQFPPDDLQVVDIASSVSHSVVVLSNGEVYGWGNGRKGQLGEPSTLVWEPRKIENVDFSVVRAICGREFTLLLGIPSGGKAKILGSDKWGLQSNAPPLLQRWQNVCANWHGITVQNQDGVVHTWGRNDRGQLLPNGQTSFRSMAAGSEHGIATLSDGKVICWGWGEHGNCGPNIDENAKTVGGWQEIHVLSPDISPDAIFLGAGCATSFFGIQSI